MLSISGKNLPPLPGGMSTVKSYIPELETLS